LADVQIDHGEFTRVANSILEQIAKVRLNGTQYAIVMVVWRFTYGFQRTEAPLSLGTLSRENGRDKQLIKTELAKLVDRKIIVICQEHTRTQAQFLKFNKDYDLWVNRESGKTTTVEEIHYTGVDETPHCGVGQTPYTLKKDIKKKKDNNPPTPLPENCPYDDILVLYHTNCISFPKVRELTDNRKKTLRARWKKYQSTEPFKELFQKAEASDFLSGRNDKWHNCNFDWMVNESNMVKVLEGSYDNNRDRPPPKPDKFVKHGVYG
jgi:phage replication O-like protein O